MTFAWKDEYKLGIADIDAQHQHYFELASKLDDLLEKGTDKPKDEVVDMLGQLQNYAFYHFATEEAYFEKYDYAEAKAHRQMHEAYRVKMKEYVEQTYKPDVNYMKLAREVDDFAVRWLAGHILVADRLYVETFKTHRKKK